MIRTNLLQIARLACVAWLFLTGDRLAAQEHSLSITGPEELVFSHEQRKCHGDRTRSAFRDRTDKPVTAFRRKDGSVVVLASNQNNFYLEGSSVETARQTECKSLVEPVNDADPAKFKARRWLFAIHAKNYDHVYGFIHNEYHGNDFTRDGCVKTSQRDFECWYGSTTLVVSKDGGRTFEDPSPPNNVLATPPAKFATNKKRVGANTPKVVGNPNDGMTYVMVNYLDRNREMRAQQCLLRSSGEALDDWRAWNGREFKLDMRSPYVIDRGPDCVAVFPYVVTSVKYVPAIKKFLAIGGRGPAVIYTFSDDLITWSKSRTLPTIARKQTQRDGRTLGRAYFSLLDPDSSSINFDTLEARPYLYFVQYGDDPRKSDLYRVPVAIK